MGEGFICYSPREMNVRWFTTRAAFLIVLLAICLGGTIPKQTNAEASLNTARLRFEQTTAYSDFDSDGVLDEARLDANGSRRNVSVLLSGARGLTSFRFEARGLVGHGSLFARDIDNDGAADLIWTDLLRSENVLVWFGDGTGEFERLKDSRQFVGAFTLGDTSIAAPSESDPETELTVEANPPLEHALIQKCIDRAAIHLPSQSYGSIASSSPTLSQPTDRGPPSLLS